MSSIGPIPRAERYTLRAPIRYRRAGEEAWIDGTTVDISRSGVLFAANRALDADDRIELLLTLSAAHPRAADVAATGRVVRVRYTGENRIEVAASIEDYRFEPPAGASFPART